MSEESAECSTQHSAPSSAPSTLSPVKKLGILISGRGSNMESLIKAARDGSIRNAEVALVISNVVSAAGIGKSRRPEC